MLIKVYSSCVKQGAGNSIKPTSAADQSSLPMITHETSIRFYKIL